MKKNHRQVMDGIPNYGLSKDEVEFDQFKEGHAQEGSAGPGDTAYRKWDVQIINEDPNNQKVTAVNRRAIAPHGSETAGPEGNNYDGRKRQEEENIAFRDVKCCGCYRRYVKVVTYLPKAVDKAFEFLGGSLIKHPFLWMAFCFVIIILCFVGFINIKSETKTERLFVPQESQTEKDRDKVKKYYDTYLSIRLEEFGFFPKQGNNFLTPECVNEAKALIQKVISIPGLENLCLRKPSYLHKHRQYSRVNNCSMLNPFELISNSTTALKDFNRNMQDKSTLMSNGKLPIYNEKSMIAKFVKTNNIYTGIELLRVQFRLTNNDEEAAKKWEKKFIDLIAKEKKSMKCASVLYAAQRSLDDAIAESAGGDIIFVSVSFAIMITFSNVMLGKFTNPIRGHSLLALAGVLSTGLGIGAGFGLSFACNTTFVSIVGILPFLVLSIGIDDMFIIVDEFDNQVAEPDPVKRIPKAMGRIGATITMTTLTDIVAFAVSVTSTFPAIKYFCTFAAVTFTVEFFLQVTLFVVFLYFDARRMQVNRRECLPFCKGKDEACCLKGMGDENLSKIVARKYATILLTWPCKVCVLLASGGLLAFGIYGCFFVSHEFSRTTLVKDGSDFLTYLDKVENDFDVGLPVSLVKIGVADYGNDEIQKEINENGYKAAVATSLYQTEYGSWMKTYSDWSQKAKVNIKGTNFTRNLPHFLSFPPFAHYNLDIKFNGKGEIEASRTQVFMIKTKLSTEQTKAMVRIREEFNKQHISLVPYSDVFIYFEQFDAVVGEVTRNLCVAAAAVILITLPFCVSPVVVVLLLFGFASLITELFGLMYFWDISINSISMINLVMSIGFAIDYSAHIAHAFVSSAKQTTNERIIDAISSLGASVFMGGASTFLGMLITGFASSEIFRIFFRMMIGIVGFGLFNGLVLLPVMFSIFGFLITPLSDV